MGDFEFKNITDKEEQGHMVDFIKRYEWLGSVSQYTTHWFGAYYKGILSGVVLFNVPNSFSKIVGEDTEYKERLISRGACISWSPKNLASALIMFSIKWMVKNTPYRVFTAYADPEAKELGTIYQACNFYYLGNNFGTKKKYINPYTNKPVSDRAFRQKSMYKRIAKELNIPWDKTWSHRTGMSWENVPDDVETKLKEESKRKEKEAEKIKITPKHKYVYILGKNKKETKELKKIFKTRNKTYPYPKERGR